MEEPSGLGRPESQDPAKDGQSDSRFDPGAGEQVLADARERHVREQADEADDEDRREDVLVVPVAGLLVDEIHDARGGPHELRDDEIRPGPPEQDPHVGAQIDHDGRDDDLEEQLGAARAERLSGLEQRRVHLSRGVGDHEDLLKERPDEDDGNLGGVVDAENGDGERPERRRRQVAKELEERLGEPGEERERAAQDPERYADRGGQREAPEDHLDVVPEALVRHGSLGDAGAS